jgi:hypothetical protein
LWLFWYCNYVVNYLARLIHIFLAGLHKVHPAYRMMNARHACRCLLMGYLLCSVAKSEPIYYRLSNWIGNLQLIVWSIVRTSIYCCIKFDLGTQCIGFNTICIHIMKYTNKDSISVLNKVFHKCIASINLDKYQRNIHNSQIIMFISIMVCDYRCQKFIIDLDCRYLQHTATIFQ